MVKEKVETPEDIEEPIEGEVIEVITGEEPEEVTEVREEEVKLPLREMPAKGKYYQELFGGK